MKKPVKKVARTKKKKDPNKLTRTVSNWDSFDNIQNQIFDFMSHEAKNIYNTTIFHKQVFMTYSNHIFRRIQILVNNKEISTIAEVDAKVLEIYDEFYNRYIILKPFRQHNNDIIYKFIKENLDVYLINDIYQPFEKFALLTLGNSGTLKFPDKCKREIHDELFPEIVSSILKSFYNKNFNLTKSEILAKKKCTINNGAFICKVKKNIKPFRDVIKNTSKPELKKHSLFRHLPEKMGIKSDENYVARIVYKYYTEPKIPSDLMCNIIAKAQKAYTSYFALRKKGIKANVPKFLKKDSQFILPFFPRSRKEVEINGKTYYRLTVGSTIADQFRDIIDDKRLICINDAATYKLYVYEHHLIPIPPKIKLFKKDNYFYGDYYIPKSSPNIINSYYVFIRKPKILMDPDYTLKLIEIVPAYKYYRYTINFVYNVMKSNNVPKKGKIISMDLGMKNLVAIYDPSGEQFLIRGTKLTGDNNYYNKKIDKAKSLLAKQKRTKKTDLPAKQKKTDKTPLPAKQKKTDKTHLPAKQNRTKKTHLPAKQKRTEKTTLPAKQNIIEKTTLPAKQKRTEKTAYQLYMKDLLAEAKYIYGENPSYVQKRMTRKDNYRKMIENQTTLIKTDGRVDNTKKKIQKTSKRIRSLLIERENKIKEFFNKLVSYLVDKYKDCEKIIVGYNLNWKTKVNMGRKTNRQFYDIPYAKFLYNLKAAFEKNNQQLILNEESYTSKCDALALEEVAKHENYLGNRITRDFFSSSTRVLINADINGAINIMKKWKAKNGITMKKITGTRLCNPKKLPVKFFTSPATRAHGAAQE